MTSSNVAQRRPSALFDQFVFFLVSQADAKSTPVVPNKVEWSITLIIRTMDICNVAYRDICLEIFRRIPQCWPIIANVNKEWHAAITAVRRQLCAVLVHHDIAYQIEVAYRGPELTRELVWAEKEAARKLFYCRLADFWAAGKNLVSILQTFKFSKYSICNELILASQFDMAMALAKLGYKIDSVTVLMAARQLALLTPENVAEYLNNYLKDIVGQHGLFLLSQLIGLSLDMSFVDNDNYDIFTIRSVYFMTAIRHKRLDLAKNMLLSDDWIAMCTNWQPFGYAFATNDLEFIKETYAKLGRLTDPFYACSCSAKTIEWVITTIPRNKRLLVMPNDTALIKKYLCEPHVMDDILYTPENYRLLLWHYAPTWTAAEPWTKPKLILRANYNGCMSEILQHVALRRNRWQEYLQLIKDILEDIRAIHVIKEPAVFDERADALTMPADTRAVSEAERVCQCIFLAAVNFGEFDIAREVMKLLTCPISRNIEALEKHWPAAKSSDLGSKEFLGVFQGVGYEIRSDRCPGKILAHFGQQISDASVFVNAFVNYLRCTAAQMMTRNNLVCLNEIICCINKRVELSAYCVEMTLSYFPKLHQWYMGSGHTIIGKFVGFDDLDGQMIDEHDLRTLVSKPGTGTDVILPDFIWGQ